MSRRRWPAGPALGLLLALLAAHCAEEDLLAKRLSQRAGHRVDVVAFSTRDDGTLLEFEYSNRRASHVGDRLTTGGSVKLVDPESGEVEIELFVRNEEGEVTTPGAARVRLE